MEGVGSATETVSGALPAPAICTGYDPTWVSDPVLMNVESKVFCNWGLTPLFVCRRGCGKKDPERRCSTSAVFRVSPEVPALITRAGC